MFLALLIFLVVLAFIVWLVSQGPFDATIMNIVRGIAILIAILAVLDALGITHFGILSSIPIGR